MDRPDYAELGYPVRAAMAFIPAIAHTTGLGNENTFYLLRVALGGSRGPASSPGIIFYLTLWFPAQYPRARIVGYFMAAIPLSTVIGAPNLRRACSICMVVSVLPVGSGCFIVEGRAPRSFLPAWYFFYLTDRPADAAWLAA